MNRLAKVSPIGLAMLIALMIGGVVYAEGPPAVDTTSLTVGGMSKTLEVGHLVYQPEVTPTRSPAACNTPTIEVTIDSVSGISGVTLYTDENCVVTVYEIRYAPEGDEDQQAYDPSVIEYYGWAKAELDDAVGIDLAAVTSEVEYFYNGSAVYGGHDDGAYCVSFNYPGGWSIDSCTYSAGLTGPSAIWVRGQGEFHHGITNTDIWMHSDFHGWASGNSWYASCADSGNNPPGTYWGCDGGRDRLN